MLKTLFILNVIYIV